MTEVGFRSAPYSSQVSFILELMHYFRQVILHTIASFTFGASSNEYQDTSEQFPSSMPPGLGAQLSIVAGFLAVAVGRYTEAVRHVKQAAHAATVDNSPERQDRVGCFGESMKCPSF